MSSQHTHLSALTYVYWHCQITIYSVQWLLLDPYLSAWLIVPLLWRTLLQWSRKQLWIGRARACETNFMGHCKLLTVAGIPVQSVYIEQEGLKYIISFSLLERENCPTRDPPFPIPSPLQYTCVFKSNCMCTSRGMFGGFEVLMDFLSQSYEYI